MCFSKNSIASGAKSVDSVSSALAGGKKKLARSTPWSRATTIAAVKSERGEITRGIIPISFGWGTEDG
jgi:hypothetical protein